MSRIELLPASYGSYKANLHCHTTLSDGRLTPEEVQARYLDVYKRQSSTSSGVKPWSKCSATGTLARRAMPSIMSA